MRNAIFLITAMSCMVIAMGFFGRENYIVGVIVAAVGVYYIAKVVFSRRFRQLEREEAAEESVTTEKTKDEDLAALRKELEEVLVRSRSRAATTRVVFIVLSVAAALIVFSNWQLALAIVPFAAFAGYLYYKNAKAVELLESNL